MVQNSWVDSGNPEVWKGWMWRLTWKLVLNPLWWRWVAWFQSNTFLGQDMGKWMETESGWLDGIQLSCWKTTSICKKNTQILRTTKNHLFSMGKPMLESKTGPATPDPFLKCIDLRQTLCHWKGISEGLAMASFHGAWSRWKFQRLQCLGDVAGALAEEKRWRLTPWVFWNCRTDAMVERLRCFGKCWFWCLKTEK